MASTGNDKTPGLPSCVVRLSMALTDGRVQDANVAIEELNRLLVERKWRDFAKIDDAWLGAIDLAFRVSIPRVYTGDTPEKWLVNAKDMIDHAADLAVLIDCKGNWRGVARLGLEIQILETVELIQLDLLETHPKAGGPAVTECVIGRVWQYIFDTIKDLTAMQGIIHGAEHPVDVSINGNSLSAFKLWFDEVRIVRKFNPGEFAEVQATVLEWCQDVTDWLSELK